MTKSCSDCAWKLGNTLRSAGTDYAGSMAPALEVCTRFDMVLGAFGTVDQTEGRMSEADAERVANRCSEHIPTDRTASEMVAAALERGVERHPAAPGTGVLPWRLIHATETKAMLAEATPVTDRDRPSCTQCVFRMPVDEAGEAGIPLNGQTFLCTGKGTVNSALPGAERETASQCDLFTQIEGTSGQARDYREGLLAGATYAAHLAPLLEDSLVGSAERRQAEEKVEAEAIEQAKADREPTDAERAEGIAAFRRFLSDDNTRWVDLPVFDPGHFEPEERAKIPVAGSEGSPEAYLDHANLGYRVAVAWALGETPALNGPAGTGKTMLFHWLAYELGLPFERVSITASSSVDDLAGYMELHAGQTEFVLGRIPKAWAKPCVMVIDEPNAGPPEVWQFIRPITDSAKQLVIDANHGQRIERHRHSFLGMAMNPAWDWRNTGVAPLSDADGSRLLHVAVGYPDADDERTIIAEHCRKDGIEVDPTHMNALIKVAGNLRKLSDEQTLQVSWGIRQQVQVARLLPYFDLVDAYRMAVTDSLEPAQADLVLEQVNLSTAAMKGRGKKRAAQVKIVPGGKL